MCYALTENGQSQVFFAPGSPSGHVDEVFYSQNPRVKVMDNCVANEFQNSDRATCLNAVSGLSGNRQTSLVSTHNVTAAGLED